MNYFNHPNLLLQFWTAVNEDFECLVERFIRGDGWLLQDMGIILKNANISSIFDCVASSTNCGPGKETKFDHYDRAILVILDAAKTQWLAPWRSYAVKSSDSYVPPFLKRQLGGFFLLYMLYFNQPLPNRFRQKQKILMDSADVKSMHAFNVTMQLLPKTNKQKKELARQLVALFNDLVTSEAFEFGAYSEVFITSSKSIRNLFDVKFCEFMKTTYKLKDIRDQLLRIFNFENRSTFQSLIEFGQCLPASRRKNKCNVKGAKTEDMKFSPLGNVWTVENIIKLKDEKDIGVIAESTSSILRSMDFGPVLTRKRMMGAPKKLLDRELNECIKDYEWQVKKRQEKTEKIQEKKEKHTAKTRFQERTKQLWKDYLTNEYTWMDQVFATGNVAFPGSTEGCTAKYEEETLDDDDDDDDEEWETDDEDSVNDQDQENVFKKPPQKLSHRPFLGSSISQKQPSSSGSLNMPSI